MCLNRLEKSKPLLHFQISCLTKRRQLQLSPICYLFVVQYVVNEQPEKTTIADFTHTEISGMLVQDEQGSLLPGKGGTDHD